MSAKANQNIKTMAAPSEVTMTEASVGELVPFTSKHSFDEDEFSRVPSKKEKMLQKRKEKEDKKKAEKKLIFKSKL